MKPFLCLLLVATPALANPVVVNEFFGVKYSQEPVSFDVPLTPQTKTDALGFDGAPSQVEIVEPGKHARIWTLVDFDAPGQKQFTLGVPARSTSPFRVADAGSVGGVKLSSVDNGHFTAKIPVGSVTFDTPQSAFAVPGPVASLSIDGSTWFGTGYLDSMHRVKSVTCHVEQGPVYWQSRIVYAFEEDKQYTVQVRVFASKPFAMLTEDFNLGGASRFIFNYDDWRPGHYLSAADQSQVKLRKLTEAADHDFIKVEGSRCLERLVIWTQFGYFNGKTETIGLVSESGDVAIGGFLARPDRWTRAKVNHVDLYDRTESPGDRLSRGVVGLKDARQRLALEAWLVDGHREWAMFAMPAGQFVPGKTDAEPIFAWNNALLKAHVRDGIWPLDRLNRLMLAWNSDGSPVTTAPVKAAGGDAGNVLHGSSGRGGLQVYNGSNPNIRGQAPPTTGWDGSIKSANATAESIPTMAGLAATAYMAADDAAYPGARAMLPWTDPEAINPFYQGMENMNFNADLYRYVCAMAMRLGPMGHPEAKKFIQHAEHSFNMALDRYVYPQSGCWEESHGYAGHTIKTVTPMVIALKNSGYKDFTEDVRFARMLEFFVHAHAPRDAKFGRRIVPPIGDHGLSTDGPSKRFKGMIDMFSTSKHPDIQRFVRQAAWLIREDGGLPPDGVNPQPPDLRSRWLQGYGATLRAFAPAGEQLTLELANAVAAESSKDKPAQPQTLILNLSRINGQWQPTVTGSAPRFNTGSHTGSVQITGTASSPHFTFEVTVHDDKWVKGGTGVYKVTMHNLGASCTGSFTGTFNGHQLSGDVTGRLTDHQTESYIVVRAGQSWGHHHADKGSLWGWFRNVHFFGDCDWGAPPGGTYWNMYKQGPASGTQIEFAGINNWTLPCKYPAPWISDEQYDQEFDYVNARCLYPYNPDLDLSRSTPVALRNGYDRQVLFVHPDLMIVRDNIETTCPTIWRLHSYQPSGTTVTGSRATLVSPHNVTGQLAILHPASATLTAVDHDDLNPPDKGRGKFAASIALKWDMPANTSATWSFAAHHPSEPSPRIESIDDQGRVTKITLGNGQEIIAFLNRDRFQWKNADIEFDGTVGLVIRPFGKPTRAHPIRVDKLNYR